MNLYEIDEKITEAFEAAVDQDTGEIIDEQAYEALNGLQMDREQKIEGILLWIKDLSAHAGDIKKEKDTLVQRQKAAENKAESLKRYVASVLSGEKFSTSRVAVSWRKSESVEYTGDINNLPGSCIRQKDPEINKTALKKLLVDGYSIPGARIVEKQNMQIK